MSVENQRDQMKYNSIVKKKWEEINEKELVFLYLECDLIRAEIADLFNVSKSKVSYKLSKYGINKQNKQAAIITELTTL